MMAQLLDELFGAEAAQSIHAPYSLGDKQELTALFAKANLGEVSIRTLSGQARFASLEDWIYTDIKGWTLADTIDDEEYGRLQQQAPSKLSRFVQADGSVAFDAPAHIATVIKDG